MHRGILESFRLADEADSNTPELPDENNPGLGSFLVAEITPLAYHTTISIRLMVLVLGVRAGFQQLVSFERHETQTAITCISARATRMETDTMMAIIVKSQGKETTTRIQLHSQEKEPAIIFHQNFLHFSPMFSTIARASTKSSCMLIAIPLNTTHLL